MSTRPASMEPVIFTPQTVYCGDNLEILKHFPSEAVDLVYIDPPFNSNRNYEVFWGDHQEKRAFDDRYGDAMAYINYMRPRIAELHRVLKPTGSFYYHCDWHASHYIKMMLDELFGANNFQSEIVWKRQTAHNDPNGFGNITESLFYYSKSNIRIWNKQFVPYSRDYIDSHYKNVEADTGRKFTYSDLVKPKGSKGYHYKLLGVDAPPNGWRMPETRAKQWLSEGKIAIPDKGKKPRFKRYLDEMPGVVLQNLWNDIPPINSQAKEALGYPTQKPLALLERIIKASSNEGDLVLDGFCGCGTTLVAAQQLGRKFIGIDISPTSTRVMGERLELVCGMKSLPITANPIFLWGDIVGATPASPTQGSGGVPAAETESGGTEAAATNKKTGEAGLAPTKNFYRYSNLPRTREELRALPGFEFENWAVLELGQVLQHQGIGAFAQANRSKVGDMGLDGKLYLVDNVSLIEKGKETLFGEKQPYLPIQVKNKDKAGRPDMDSFAHALRRDKRRVGFFISWEFTKDAHKEIDRLMRLPQGGDENPVHIIPVRVDELLTESFKLELLLWQGS